MFRPLALVAAFSLYMTGLFAIALWVERGSARARQWARSPYTYALALAVYCSSWTFYGSVGSAVRDGALFLTVYLGPTLAVILWGLLLRKLVRLKEAHLITSIADLISARHGKSQSLAAFATLLAAVGTTPYIALQIRSIGASFQVIAGPTTEVDSWLAINVGGLVTVLMVGFTIAFGARRLDPTERHPGLLVALAVECLVKVVAFVAVGVFVTFVLFPGPTELFARIAASPAHDFLQPKGPNASPLVFFSFLVLSMSAIQFLPRQFHVAVVENSDERHIHTAAWVLPLYLLIINLFVIPLAAAAILGGVPRAQLDTVVLQLPHAAGHHWLALLVFLGGFSAATGMLIVESLAVSTMVTNHLLVPVIERAPRLGFLRRHLLRVRWAAIAGVLLIGYAFDRAMGNHDALAHIGMISFAAIIQLAPIILGGLYWRGGTARGAKLGLGAGAALWFYTLLVPIFARSGLLPASILDSGPLGLAFLRPEALLFVDGLHPVPHALLFSLFANTSFYVLGSLLSSQTAAEQRLAESFVGPSTRPALAAAAAQPRPAASDYQGDEATIDLATKQPMINTLLQRYFAPNEADVLQRRCLERLGVGQQQRVSVGVLAALYGEVERALAGSIGAAAAHHAVRQGLAYTKEEMAQLPQVYARILADLKVSPDELKRRIDYYQDRAAFLEGQAALLEARVDERTHELIESNRRLQAEVAQRQRAQQELSRSNEELEQFAYVASHDLQEPLRTVASYLQLIERRYDDKLDDDGREFIGFAVDGAKRMQSLINDLLTYARIGTRGKPFVVTDTRALVATVLDDLRSAIIGAAATVTCTTDLPTVCGDDMQLKQLFRNLIGNALKFHGQTPPVVRIAAEQDDGCWHFSIADNGIGIEERFFAQLFRLFHRLHTRAAYPGNGIGLALCKKIIERHAGRIWVESTPGRGATFHFTIPERPATTAVVPTAPATPAASTGATASNQWVR